MEKNSPLFRWFYKNRTKRLQRPVFIVGCGHSGTSILLRVIGAHSGFLEIEDESNLFYKSNREKLSAIQDWVKILEKENKRRTVEKTPSHVYCIEEIFRTFEDRWQSYLYSTKCNLKWMAQKIRQKIQQLMETLWKKSSFENFPTHTMQR